MATISADKFFGGKVPPPPTDPIIHTPEQDTNMVAEFGKGFAKGAGDTLKAGQDLAVKAGAHALAGPFDALPGVSDKIDAALSPIVKAIQDKFGLTDENLKAANTAQKIGKGAEFAAEIATPFVEAKLASLAPDLVKVAQKTAPKAEELLQKTRSVITPTKKPVEAVAQVVQGKADDVPGAANALSTIDTKGVKTYQDLLARLDTKIPDLATSVDTELAKDTTRYSLDQLTAKQTSKGGKSVVTDYVTRALDDLKNLYTATGDDVAKTNIEEIISHAKDQGLTRKEVNDISRIYGQEFGSKAFSKTGEPLTTTNAQAFETTRSGLKGVARQGLGGKEAEALDSTLSDLYDTRRLVQRNVDAVQKLEQRIQQRGLVEKAGYLVSKYADILSGGSLRGIIGGLLPRGAGYKVMNALDLQDALRKNLDVIEKALAANSDNDLIAALEKALPKPKDGPKALSQ